ncbi:MAG: hypothetical protein ACREU9_06505 [Gammaproteobacteria bacterium]
MGQAINSNDTYSDRVLKNIPSDVLGAYLAASGMMISSDAPAVLQWIVFGICAIAAPFWLYFYQGVKSILQCILAFIAFFLWVMAAGGPFSGIGVAQMIGSVGLILFSGLVAPLLGKMASNR